MYDPMLTYAVYLQAKYIAFYSSTTSYQADQEGYSSNRHLNTPYIHHNVGYNDLQGHEARPVRANAGIDMIGG